MSYYVKGVKQTGWVVSSTYKGYGLQRYWLGSDGNLVTDGLVAKKAAGYWAYATKDGYVVRGRYAASGNRVYLADNDGKLEKTGWRVTSKYTPGDLQRYYVDRYTHAARTGFFKVSGDSYYGVKNRGYVSRGTHSYGTVRLVSDNDGKLATGKGWMVSGAYGDGELQRYYLVSATADGAYSGAEVGFFKVGKSSYYGVKKTGYVVRGARRYDADGTLVADNDGKLPAKAGWLVTGAYDNGNLQRYRIDDCCGGHLGAHVGLFQIGKSTYYGIKSTGYELRNAIRKINGSYYYANNDGKLSAAYPPVIGAMITRAQGYSSSTGLLIMIDADDCKVGIFTGSQGHWTLKYAWDCGPGAVATPTVTGVFSVGAKGYSFGSGYTCYYYTQFSGDYLFHSVLYYEGTNTIMDGRLGQRVSHGCVRLDINNAKWIYDNAPGGSTVVSYM